MPKVGLKSSCISLMQIAHNQSGISIYALLHTFQAQYRCECIGVFIYWLIDFLTLHSQLLLFQCSCTAVPQCNIELCSIISAHKQHMHVLTHTTTALSLLWADVLCSNVKYSLCSVRYYVLYFFHCTQTMCPCTLILTHTLHLPSSSAASGNEANDGQTNPLPALRCCTLTKYKYAVVHIQIHTYKKTQIQTQAQIYSYYLALKAISNSQLNLYSWTGNTEVHICQTHWTLMMVKPQLAMHGVLCFPQILLISFTFVCFLDLVSFSVARHRNTSAYSIKSG